MFWGFRRRTSPVTTRVFVRQTSWPFLSQGRVEAAKLRLLTALVLCLVAAAMPIGHAANNIHTFYLGNSSITGYSGNCEGLATSSGTADTGTSQSVVIGSSPILDSGSGPDRTGTWSIGSTFTLTGLTTSGTSDVIILIVVTNPQTITVSTSTPPSASGITFQAAPRQTLTPTNCAARIEEWVGTTSAVLSSVTTTVTLTGGTPTAASGQIIAYTGAKEPTGTVVNWAFDQASGFATSSDQGSHCSGGSNTPQASPGVTTLNANDLVLGLFGSENAVTETPGGSFALRSTVNQNSASNAIEDRSTSSTGTQTCPFGTNQNRWLVICDALQSAAKFYQVNPNGASTTTGTPSTSSPTGYAWVYDTAGIQSGLVDIFTGTWQFDMTVAAGSTTGVPLGRLWITVWQCGTNSLGSCTFLFKNWDTSTNNVIGSTVATKYTWTSATQPTFSGWSGKYLAVEYWTVMQYSGSTSATTATETTVSTASDIITPNWDSAQSLSGSVTLNSAEKTTYLKILSAFLTGSSNLAEKNSIFRSLSGALTSASNLAEHTAFLRSASASLASASSLVDKFSFFRSLTGSLTTASSGATKNGIFRTLTDSITITIGNLVANVDSGKLVCNTSPRACSTTVTGNWNMASSLGKQASFSRSLSDTLTAAVSIAKGIGKALMASLSPSSSLAEKNSLFRSVAGSFESATSLAKQDSLFRSLAGSMSSVSSIAEKNSLFRSLTGSLALGSSLSMQVSLFRLLTGAMSLGASQVKGLYKSLSGSLSTVSTFAEQTSVFRSLSSSLDISSTFARQESLFRMLSGSLTLNSGVAQKTSY